MIRRVVSFLSGPASGEPTRDGERGSATVWVLALMAIVWFVALAVLLGGQIRAVRHQAGAAADLAALAAADHAWRGPGVACRLAAEVADANGARLRVCAVDGDIADVTVEVQLPAVVAPLADAEGMTVRARAGPVELGARIGRRADSPGASKPA